MRCSELVAFVPALALGACDRPATSTPGDVIAYDALRDHLVEAGCVLHSLNRAHDGFEDEECRWLGPCGCVLAVNVTTSANQTRVEGLDVSAFGCEEQKIREEIPRWLGVALPSDTDRELFREAMARPSFMLFAPEARVHVVRVTHFGDVTAKLDWRPHGYTSADPTVSDRCPHGLMRIELSKSKESEALEIDVPSALTGQP